jgi:hypothetical protein
LVHAKAQIREEEAPPRQDKPKFLHPTPHSNHRHPGESRGPASISSTFEASAPGAIADASSAKCNHQSYHTLNKSYHILRQDNDKQIFQLLCDNPKTT